MREASTIRFLACSFGSAMAISVALSAPPSSPEEKGKQDKLPPREGGTTEVLPPGAIARLGDTRFRHGAAPTCILFAADSQRVISGGQDGAVRIWDVATGTELHTLIVKQTPIEIALLKDHSRLAIATADGRLRHLDARTFKELAEFSPGFTSGFAVSPEGSLLAMRENNGTVVTELSSELARVELPPGGPMAFTPDGKSIAIAEADGKVTLYKVAGGKPIATFDHGAELNGMVFSADGKRIATGSDRGGEVLKVWELGNSKPIAEIRGASKPRAWLNANQIAAASQTGAGIYDLSQKRWVKFVKDIKGEWAISPDATKIATTGSGGFHIQVFDFATGKPVHTESTTFPEVALLEPTRDGKGLFVLSRDQAFIWPVESATATPAGKLPASALVAAVANDKLAVAVAGGILIYERFDPSRPLAEKPTRTLTTFAAACKSVALSPDGKRIAYSGENARIVIANTADGSTLRVLPKQTIGLALAFTPDGEKLAVVGRDGFLRFCTVKAPAEGQADDLWTVRVQRNQKAAVAISPDGKWIAASSSTQMHLVSAADGTILHTEDCLHVDDGPYHQLAFSKDGRLLFSGSAGSNGAIQVWEMATHSLVRRSLTGFGAIGRLGVFPDGTLLVTAGNEEAITLWDLSFRKGKGQPGAEELLAAWNELGSLEGEKGYPATRVLVAGGPQAVKVMTAGYQKFLDSLSAAPSSGSRAGDSLRLVRAVQVLEDLGGKDAKELLGQIALLKGRAGDDARAAIKRLGK